ncbi:hypothetical protein KBI23_12050 [bacterium]|nr:hypothetical protein [bacterium]MBP9808646.1 hypothetical protein [bacterium]
MSDDQKEKDSLKSAERAGESQGVGDGKVSREVGSIGSTIMDAIAKKRTNASSGSLDESQDHSLEIDFGGHVESRLNHMPKPIAPSELARKGSDNLLAPVQDLLAPQDLTIARDELKRLADAAILKPNELRQFSADLDNFEKNFSARSHMGAMQKQREMANTYAQLSRLLLADSDVLARYPECKQQPGDTLWRVQVAEQLMHQVAEPFTISQGNLAICATASLQVREHYREPAAVARLVTDVILTGKYEATYGGIKVDLTACPNNLIPDLFAKRFNVENDIKNVPIYEFEKFYHGSRGFASQLFDVTATNVVLGPRGFRYEQPTLKDYESLKNAANGKVVEVRTGNSLPWGSGEGRQVVDTDLSTLAQRMTGKDERHFVISAAHLTATEAVSINVRRAYEFNNRDGGVVALFSASELAAALRATKELGQWPPIVRLDCSMPPTSMKNGGAHFLVLSELSEDGRLLAVDNTWEESRDHNGVPKIPISTISESVFSPKIRVESEAAGLMPLVNFWSQNPNYLQRQLPKWLAFPERLKEGSRTLSPTEFEHLNPDPELRDWIKRHPADKELKLWKTVLQEWLARYPVKLH